MKKKEFFMTIFIILITLISAVIIYSSSLNTSNNSKKENNVNKIIDTVEDNTNKGPTIINSTTEDLKLSSSVSDNKSVIANSQETGKLQEEKDKSISLNINEDNKLKDNSKTSDNLDNSKDYIIYRTKKGDTLLSIAKQYSDKCPISILSKAILSFNNLSKASDIKEDIDIKIPLKYTKDGLKYVVKPGDSLSLIASSNYKNANINSVIEMIMKDNFLSSYTIKSGDELFLSNITEKNIVASNENSTSTNKLEEEKSQATSSSIAAKSNISFITYKIRKDDNINTIAKKYEDKCPVNIFTKILLKVNNLKDLSGLKEGMEIKIPESYFISGKTYIIKKGDTLSSIAHNNFPDVDLYEAIDKIKSDNFMDSYNIKFGDKLFLSTLSLD